MGRRRTATQPRDLRMGGQPTSRSPYRSATINRLSRRDRLGRRWGGKCSGDGRKFARIVGREARVAGMICRDQGLGVLGNPLIAIHKEYVSRSFETDQDALRWALQNWTTVEGIINSVPGIEYKMGNDGMPERVCPVMTRRERANRTSQ